MAEDTIKTDRKKAAFHNLGCKVNSYELDLIRQDFLENGFEEADFNDPADVYIVNTCTVTGIAGKKSRQMLRRAKRKNPDAVVIAIGCYVETEPGAGNNAAAKAVLSGKMSAEEGSGEEIPADICIGSRKKLETFAIYQSYLEQSEQAGLSEKDEQSGRGHQSEQDQQPGQAGQSEQETRDGRRNSGTGKSPFRYQEDFAEQPFPKTGRGLVLPGRTRADIKVQDGCDRFCTYCIIPHVRGRITSRDEGDVVKEIQELAENGIREVILSGIHIGSYGADQGRRPEEALPDLIERVSEIEGIERIRIGSIEPVMASEEVVKRLAGIRELCPHFHLSLQSGCDRTLRRMNRRYTAEEYRKSVACLREYFALAYYRLKGWI